MLYFSDTPTGWPVLGKTTLSVTLNNNLSNRIIKGLHFKVLQPFLPGIKHRDAGKICLSLVIEGSREDESAPVVFTVWETVSICHLSGTSVNWGGGSKSERAA